ncbi:OsmC family protein [Lysinibacter sp. HNR]|uniref:OsmC family protein n=1 Tax=Lysinibacter sp. HNR TaxID=3031408 RepID=UPI002434F74A|nr:OsmC family protein [Lysinibacter sp. HNR]WGD38248.1 OsmC family protein [Lysinibacter sp. HNR]
MRSEHRYEVTVEWQGNNGTGTSGYRDYSRKHTIYASGKHPVEGSADSYFWGDSDRWNPEEMLLASLSQCHMLSYLYVAARDGIVVTSYRDRVSGTIRLDGGGGGEFTSATLSPVVTIAEEEMALSARTAHQIAGKLCFIARSVNFPIAYEPVIHYQDSSGEARV